MSYKLYLEGFFERENVRLLNSFFGFFKYIFYLPLLLTPLILILPPALLVFLVAAMICLRFLADYIIYLLDGDLLLLGELLVDLNPGLIIVKCSLRLTDYSWKYG